MISPFISRPLARLIECESDESCPNTNYRPEHCARTINSVTNTRVCFFRSLCTHRAKLECSPRIIHGTISRKSAPRAARDFLRQPWQWAQLSHGVARPTKFASFVLCAPRRLAAEQKEKRTLAHHGQAIRSSRYITKCDSDG